MPSETLSSSEIMDLMSVRSALKPLQKEGLALEVSEGKIIPKYSESQNPSPVHNETITVYLNAIASELSGVRRDSILVIIDELNQFSEDSTYVEDMIHYGTSLEDDYAKKRMERLKNVRNKVTEAQMSSQPGFERVQSVKAATFVRSHLPDLGLKTTINYLELLS